MLLLPTTVTAQYAGINNTAEETASKIARNTLEILVTS